MKIIRCLILTLVVYFATFSIHAQASRIDKFVDLGLPSGLLWGSANLGAESSSDFGGYYIMNPEVDRITVDVVNGVISVIGLPLGVAVTIFDLNGVIVYSGIPQDIPSLGNGIYIVDVMSKMHKVIL